MRKINEILAAAILSLLAVLAAAVGFRAYDTYIVSRQEEAQARHREEVLLRNREANGRVLEMRQEIQELSGDRERLRQFFEEIQAAETEAVPVLAIHGGGVDGMSAGMTENAARTESLNLSESETVSENSSISENDTVSENNSVSENDTVSENSSVSENKTVSETDSVSGNETVSENNSVSGNETISETDSVSGNDAVSENNSVSGNDTVSENSSVSENETVSENSSISENETVSGNNSVSDNDTVSENGSVSGNETVSENETLPNDMQHLLPGAAAPEMTLEERRQYRTSLEETLLVNEEDRALLAECQTDFSDVKIACLGDSITAASNLEGEADYLSYAYPSVLGELLGAEEVYNLGVGGSSIGRYWSDAFVDRYREIPQDTDIIIVMGGTNDGFCLSAEDFGTFAERTPGTFLGDLDELMRGLKENYPDARIFFATPLPNILQDYLMRERAYLLPQKDLADAILALSSVYGFETIDLYNSNILDSHDADIVADYMPDGVHCNKEGYQILAEHIAAELVRSSMKK